MAHDVERERERAWSIRTPKNRIRVLNLNMQIFGGNGFFLSIYLCVHFLGRFRSLSPPPLLPCPCSSSFLLQIQKLWCVVYTYIVVYMYVLKLNLQIQFNLRIVYSMKYERWRENERQNAKEDLGEWISKKKLFVRRTFASKPIFCFHYAPIHAVMH